MISTETKRVPSFVLPGIRYRGYASNFGGPRDEGVGETEGVALYTQELADDHPELFLPRFVTMGGVAVDLARRLIPGALYCACRWDYGATPKPILRTSRVLVQRVDCPDQCVVVAPVDFGPARRLDRIIDLSPGAFNALKLVENTKDHPGVEVFVTLQTPSCRWSELEPKVA